jgi:DNA-binding response OmpR family regulator
MTAVSTDGRRFLVVEDEAMIVLLLEDFLADLGHEMRWHADTIDDALRIVENETGVEAAILDMNLHGRSIDPVVAALAARGVPFCIMTGLGSLAEATYPSAPVVGKPFDITSLSAALERLFPPS